MAYQVPKLSEGPKLVINQATKMLTSSFRNMMVATLEDAVASLLEDDMTVEPAGQIGKYSY